MSGTKHIVIIGAGPTALFSVFACGMLGFRCTLLDRMPSIGGQCNLYPDKPIYDIPGFPMILARDLIANLSKQIAPFNPEIILNRLVSTLDEENGRFYVGDDQNAQHAADAIIIAAGKGAFSPRKLDILDIEQYEGTQVLYDVSNKHIFDNKNVVIAGGGDSAADWTIELAPSAKRLSVVHRRTRMSCHESSNKNVQELFDQNKIDFYAPYQIHAFNGHEVSIKNIEDKTIQTIPCDYLLAFFGLQTDLGSFHKWDLGIDMHKIPVDPTTMMTKRPGVFAIGDIAEYQNKLHLIANGFSEAFTCAYSIRSFLFPNKKFHFEYSTTSGIPQI